LICYSLLLCWAGTIFGQDLRPAPPREAAGSYLNTSFEAQERLNAANRIFDKGRFSEAATQYQEAAEKFGDFLIADGPNSYTTIRTRVNRLICSWPAPALTAYRQIYDVPATEALARIEGSADYSDYLNIADRYFPTSAAARAMDQAAQLALERGDLACALQWIDTLLSSHPDARTRKADWLARAATCRTWLGREIPQGNPDESKPDDLSASVTIHGDVLTLGDYLASLKHDAPPATSQPEINSTPAVFAGGEDRRGMFQTSALPEARLWRFTDFGRPSLESIFDGYESQVARRDAISRALQSGRLLASVAAAASPSPGVGPWVYLSDGASVWAIDPTHPEKAVWRFEITGGATARQGWTAEEDTPPLYTCMVDNGRVYVALERELNRAGSDQPLVSASLLCLDATKGSLIWRNDLKSLMSEFEETRLDGAPLRHADKLFAIARRRKPFGFEACYLLRFNLQTGALESSVHVGEAATGSYGYHRATLAHAAASGDLVFVASNLGTVAAVNAFTGRLEWLRKYESRYTEAAEGLWPTRMGRPARSWHYQPVMLWRDSLLVMPLDAEEVFFLDQSDGTERRRLSLDNLLTPELILGIHEDRLYAAGSQIVCYDLAQREIVWQRPIEDGQLFGRGALTTNGILVPTDQALLCYPRNGGPPRIHRWSNEDAGNLTVLPDQIICASALSVSGLMSKNDAFVRLDTRMRDNPTDPQVALAVADLAFSTSEYERGLRAVNDALARSKSPPDSPDRKRFFQRLLAFAESVLDQPAPDNPTLRDQTVIQLLTLAGPCSSDPLDQVNFRLRLAHAYLRSHQPALAAATYQEILSNPVLRHVTLKVNHALLPPAGSFDDDAEEQSAAAGLISQRSMNRLIESAGKEIYAPIEKNARASLQRAVSDHDASAVLEVAAAFPNSDAAGMALIAHARWAAEKSEWNDAALSYSRALRRKDVPERAAALREYIECLVAAGRHRLADQWLIRAIRDYPSYRFTSDKKSLSFGDFRERLIKDRQFREPAHDMRLASLSHNYKRLFTERCTILDSLNPRLPTTRWDSIITWSVDKLESRAAIDGRALWSRPYDVTAQPSLLGMDEARYILATQHSIFALTRGSGQLVWELGHQPKPDPMSDPESNATWSHHVMTASRLYSVNDDGELTALDLATGNVLWRTAARLPVGSQLAANDTYVCYSAWEENNHSIVILDAATGAKKSALQPDRDWPVQSLLLTADGSILVVLSSAIQSYDVATAALRWQITTPDRYLLSSLQMDDDGIIVSGDGRRLTKYALDTGEAIWTSGPLCTESGENIWAEVSDGWLVAAANDRLAVLDTADGRTLWSMSDSMLLKLEPPRILSDAILLVSEERPRLRPKGRAAPGIQSDPAIQQKNPQDAAQSEQEHGKRFRLTALDLQTGKPRKFGDQDFITTDAIDSYGGLYVRDRAVILLDGQRLLGYVGN
jgi:outer membrane protein assembly factor BamB/tetratricopeptide (TPR) repeat protein